MPESTLISQDWLELAPAYGRDYKSRKEVEAGFRAGKDWILPVSHGGSYYSVVDFKPGTKVLLRYKRLTQVASITV